MLSSRFVLVRYSSLSWDKTTSLLSASKAKRKRVNCYKRTNTMWMSGNVRARRRYPGSLAVYVDEIRSGGGVMCESSEKFRTSDSVHTI